MAALGLLSKSAEPRYSTFDRELLGIYLATKHFQYFVEGCHFTYSLTTSSLMHSPPSKSDTLLISQCIWITSPNLLLISAVTSEALTTRG
jgi:hypothetical protein